MTLSPRYLIFLSIVAALVTLGMKSTAYCLTGSVGLLADAMESSINLLTASAAAVALWYSARPVDPSHTYGHEKIEYFASGLEGVLILIAAIGIAFYAVRRLFIHEALESLGLGVIIALAASFVNLAVAQALLRAAKKLNSIVLEADGRHLMTDVWTSFGVSAGLLLVRLTGREIFDPLLALVVAAHIVYTSADLIMRSFNGLMDHALPEKEQAVMRSAVDRLLPPGCHYHAVRTRQAGARRFVDFHLLVPGRWTVREAHDFTERVEEAVRSALPGAEVTVHIEPIEAQSAWHDSELLRIENPPPPAEG